MFHHISNIKVETKSLVSLLEHLNEAITQHTSFTTESNT